MFLQGGIGYHYSPQYMMGENKRCFMEKTGYREKEEFPHSRIINKP